MRTSSAVIVAEVMTNKKKHSSAILSCVLRCSPVFHTGFNRNANTLDTAAAGALGVRHRGRHISPAGFPPPPQLQQQRQLSMSIGFPAAEGIRGFFASSSISSVMNAANNVPPVYYFIYLLAAGVGES